MSEIVREAGNALVDQTHVQILMWWSVMRSLRSVSLIAAIELLDCNSKIVSSENRYGSLNIYNASSADG